MESSSASSRQAHCFLQVGVALFLVAALLGLAVPQFAVPRVALSAHLVGILQGIFLVVVGLLWPKLTFSPIQSHLAFGLLIYQAVAAPLSNLLAAVWGAGNSIIPMAATMLMAALPKKLL
jgi:hydroxylaminobenzene mutase